ncbi:PAS domain-containing protein [Anoxybacterium hadale]|uniref:PAS domain-containing protein n=1 Tax=Anoxybacterium hadale TaxID=3408580 RepID=A0ACD1A757_9FIRM|nr:PAS domain-containing protein [Clostridiales bacterium]
MQFTKEYQEKLQSAWEHFTSEDDEQFDYTFIRPMIFQSWLRSRMYQVNPFEKKTAIMDLSEIAALAKANSRLIKTVRPYMEKLYSIVEGSGYFLLLSDKDGYVLDLIGDHEMIEQAKESLLVVGANRSESVAGTNAIGTCLAIQAPIQIWNGEHYVISHRHYSCSSGPIFDSTGALLGCLNITGSNTEIHTHTLGMVLSAVDGINKELKIRKAYDEIESMSAQRNSILEAVTSGLILLNEDDEIIQMNGNAQRMLHISGQNAIGRNINSIISIDEPDQRCNFYALKSAYSDKETDIYFAGSYTAPIKFRISVSFVGQDKMHDRGTVIRLDEAKYINKLVNKVSGFKASYHFSNIMGSSSPARFLVSSCEKAARNSSNVLLLGESGTGKELAAQSIHNASYYRDGPFVAINCAALPKGLIESELFGYEKGAFTGAGKEGNPGKFELADGGTIFLDEIGDMPLDVQASLLRVIQTREVVRIGAKYTKKIDVRIIAATNRNLLEEVSNKSFRQDLYYRLNVLTIQMPPLRDRGDDICELADHFAQTLYNPWGRRMTISPQVYPLLKKYSWPGNIRELENAIERAINITDDDQIRPEHLPEQILVWENTLERFDQSKNEMASQLNQLNQPLPVSSFNLGKKDCDLIHLGLKQTGGNIRKTADLLGISRRTLYRRMDKYGIDYGNFRD